MNYKKFFESKELADENNNTPIAGDKILLLADNQKALLTTEPVMEQSKLAEEALNTAHRKAALDAFSNDIVAYLANSDEYKLIIHGGDILNNSCQWEFDSVVNVMDETGKPWFVAPGNHDGYYLGITSPRGVSKGFFQWMNGPLDERRGWAQACTTIKDKVDFHGGKKFDAHYKVYEKNVLDKVSFIGNYLSAIGVRKKLEVGQVKANNVSIAGTYDGYEGYNVKCVNFLEYEGGLHKGVMSDVCWTQYRDNNDFFNDYHPDTDPDSVFGDYEEQWDEGYPWRNFLVQKLEVDLDGKVVDFLIVDTASYSPGFALTNTGWARDVAAGAADNAHISALQQEIINGLLSRRNKKNELVIVGHHPLLDFDTESFIYIENIYQNNKAVRYISGDTHSGYEACFRRKSEKLSISSCVDDLGAIRETNLGSTIDAPIEYAKAGLAEGGFVTQRYSLTPLTKYSVGRESHGEGYKESKNPRESQYYAKFDSSLWDESCHSFSSEGKYVRNESGYNPFGQPKASKLTNLELDEFWGVKYIMHPVDGFFMRLYIYKINRLIWLNEIYHQLYRHAGGEVPVAAKELLSKISGPLNVVHQKTNSLFGRLDKEELYELMKNLSELIDVLESESPRNPKAIAFRLCSALYEAENEYKGSSVF